MTRQFTIIIAILSISYMIETSLGIPFPASIMGMLILTVLLFTKVIKVEEVEQASNILQRDIILFIIPLTIGIVDSIDLFQGKFLITILIVAISTIISIFATALIMKIILNKKLGSEGKNDK